MTESYGYHIKKIPKGTAGEFSKILEEVLECQDALEQGSNIMALVELSDTVGAIDLYLRKYYSSITVNDLLKMAWITERAFISGDRK